MHKSTRYSMLLAVLLVAALIGALILRKEAPPEVARLLPESDAILYANVKPLRLATHLDKQTITRSKDYQTFIDATGIEPERDLDSMAFALHRMDDPTGPNGPVAYSEVFEGHFNGERLSRYLSQIAVARERYAGHDVFTIPVGEPGPKGERRMLRVAQVGYDTVAASNMPTSEQIHSMLDRHRAAASPFSGSSLLTERYGDVPLLASAWGIGHVGLPFSEGGRISIMGLQLPLTEDTTFVASLRYVGSLRLRIEDIAPSEAEATQTTQVLGTLLGLVKSMELAQPRTGADQQMRQVLDSLKVEQKKDRAVVTGTVPVEMLRTFTGAAASAGETAGANTPR